MTATTELAHPVGRVCFHLAENANDAQYPFAFLATFAADDARAKHQPLSRAIEHYAGEDNKAALAQLLKPVVAASQLCDWVRSLVDSGDIYHPLAWAPGDAYQLLQSVPQLEASGLKVRLPNWWRTRSKAKVQATIGDTNTNAFGQNQLLDFNVNVALGDDALSKDELAALMASEDKLVYLRGQWVEVDAKKLKQAIDHFDTIKTRAGNEGLSFVEGMRLLAGVRDPRDDNTQIGVEAVEWGKVVAGRGLLDLLKAMREPKANQSDLPTAQLNATLRPYQEVGVAWLRLLSELGLGACLADDMGLGKTIQIIALLLLLKPQLTINPSLIVVPASLLANWKNELRRFAPSVRFMLLHQSEMPKARLDQIAMNPELHLGGLDVVITTYGMLRRQAWLLELQWQLAIIDEAQAIKNPNSNQSKAVKQLKAKSRIALTGTPVENRLGDLWSLFDFLCPGLMGSSSEFKKYLKQLNENAQSYAAIRTLVQPYILRRHKTDKDIIDDLPDKSEMAAWCLLSKQQAALYQVQVERLARAISSESGIKRRGLVLATLMQLKQICNHPSQFNKNGDYEPEASGKFQRLRELCQEIAARGEKVLVFTQFREMTRPLCDYLSGIFEQPGLIIDGSTPVKKRQDLVAQFQQDEGAPFFVLSLKAAGVGLNLTAANHVIHFDRWWNPAVENQATDRAFRIGQKKNVLVHKFICQGTVEEKIDKLIKEKTQLANEVVEGKDEVLLTEMDDQALLDLVTLDLSQIQN